MNDSGWPQEECDQVPLAKVWKDAFERYKGKRWAQWNLSEDAIKDCVSEALKLKEKPPKNPNDSVGCSRGYWLFIIPDIYKKVCEHTGQEPAKESWKMSSDKWWYEENA